MHGIYFCIRKNIDFCKTYSFAYAELYVLLNLRKTTYFEEKKKRRAFYEEARTTKITRDTVLSFAYDYMYSLLL